MIAEAWRPGGYLAISFSAHALFSGVKAKLSGCLSAVACLVGETPDGHDFASAIHFAEHDVERAEDRADVGQHVLAAEEIHRLQMREARRAQLAAVGLVGPIRHQIDAELALRRLDRG